MINQSNNMENLNIDERSSSDLFERFIGATTMKNVISIHKRILDSADLKPCNFNTFFPRYKHAVTSDRQRKNWKAKALFSKIEKRANHRCYSNTRASSTFRASDNPAENCMDDSLSSQTSNSRITNNNALQNYNCLIIGSGPAGLRTAIEMQLLGSDRVVVVEKRGRFSRNNVLHLWPFVIDDLKSLGAKKFYGKFCAGSIDHISIRQLQLILLKVCLMTGCDFRDSCSYINLCPSSIDQKYLQSTVDDDSQEACDKTWCIYKPEETANQCTDDTRSDSNEFKCDSNDKRISELKLVKPHTQQRSVRSLEGASAHFESDRKEQEKELHSIKWDIIIGADGRRNTLKNLFPRKEFRGRLAIAITANFINRQTTAETSVPEISGLSFIYNQDMFNALAHDTNIELENICYYKDDTHYFVMTAKKRSLLERGVLINDFATTQDLLSEKNISKEALLNYAKDAAYWTTGLKPLDFALNHYGQEDCAMFDFTSMYAASNACKALRTKQGGLALMSLVGDSLLEPFWPTGSGCARGFLSSLDAAWMCRQWAINRCAFLDYHNNTALRSSRNSNGGHKNVAELTTHDKMALSVIAERESIYRILAQTTSENLQQNYSLWTLNPHTRYPNLNRHLILPSQVEHLIADDSRSAMVPEDPRGVKPTHKSRRSPRKLKPALMSPSSHSKNTKNKTRTTRSNHRSKSRQDISYDEFDLRLEESYKYLADCERGGLTQYLSYKNRESASSDDLFVPSLSGTLPSSYNLSRLEARKARDIDECLRHRRQKTKINYVKDQLISQMRGEGQNGDKESCRLFAGGNAAIFNEIKRLKEQQSRGGRASDKTRDVSGPLSLLNSMRRCASFAERVKSFESKFANVNQVSPESSSPKTPIDNVRNLPQFATLQELFINNAPKVEEKLKKSHIPIAKLTKDDWNVKFWENRLVSCKQRQLSSSTRSLNKSVSVDSAQVNRASRLNKQAHIFHDRINEMANKLKTPNQRRSAQCTDSKNKLQTKSFDSNPARAQGWVSHLKRELTKGAEFNKRTVDGQPMNPVLPNKPIRRLFEDDDEDDGIDVNKHYDHLCINRPTNKYLSKGAYTSHLARNNVKSTIINRPSPSIESKQAYLSALTSRGSSASSNLSDYSTNTGNSSSGSGIKQTTRSSMIDVECFRCRKFVSSADRITIESSLLHRACLTCADCKITLRSNEIQHYMELARRIRAKSSQGSTCEEPKFSCAICSPEIRDVLTSGKHNYLEDPATDSNRLSSDDSGVLDQQQHFSSREAFLNSKINYSELYKNLIRNDQCETKASLEQGDEINYDTVKLSTEDGEPATVSQTSRNQRATPSPVQVTIPMKLVSDESSSCNLSNLARTDEYDLTEHETINYSEATLILPPESARVTPSPTNPSAESHDNVRKLAAHRTSEELSMIDEDELQRILHLDGHSAARSSSGDRGSSSNDSKTNEDASNTDDSDGNSSRSNARPEGSYLQGDSGSSNLHRSSQDAAENSVCESSSLEPPSDTDDYEDGTDDDIEMNSTCDDFVTTEELDNQYFDANLDHSGRQTSTSDTQESTARRTPSSAGLAAS